MGKAAAVALLVLAVLPGYATVPFEGPLPDGMPSLLRWERVAGDVVVGDRGLRVQYEFYVNPARPALYELIRYRVSRADGSTTDEHPGLEKVQWHAGTNDFRRFECGPAADRTACRWRSMPQDSEEFAREVPVILWVYGVHRQRLAASAAD